MKKKIAKRMKEVSMPIDSFAKFAEPQATNTRIFFDREELTFLVAGIIAAGMYAGRTGLGIPQEAVDQTKNILHLIRKGHI
jgi:hypothetical protein